MKKRDFLLPLATLTAAVASNQASSSTAITNTDKDLGIISASQTVSYGQGKTVPFNVTMESQGNALRVSTTYVLSGGVTSPAEAVRDEFCNVIGAVAGQ